MHRISIHLDIEVPSNESFTAFLKESPENKGKMIFLGHTLFNQCKEQIQSWSHTDIEEKISTLQQKIQKVDKERLGEKQQHKEEIETISHEIKERTNAKYIKEIQELEEKHRATRDELMTLRQTLMDNHQKEVFALREQLDLKVETVRNQCDEKLELERNKYTKHVTQDNNSSIKGQHGEQYTYHQLNMLFPKYEVKDIHSVKERGDFLVQGEDCMMMVEAKLYHKNVPLAEIEKFHRDMTLESNKDIHCGVLISLDTGICGKEDFHMEFVGEKPIIYLHHTRDQMDHIRLAWSLFQILLRQDSVDTRLETATTAFKALMKKIKRNFNQQKKMIDKHRGEQLKQVTDQQIQIVELYKHMGLSMHFN